MKLREQRFSLGAYDHLYLNFTTCLEAGTMCPASRSVDPYHDWYRFYDIGVSQTFYDALDSDQGLGCIIERLHVLLNSFFTSGNDCAISECILEAVSKGEQLMVLYKTKQATQLCASIYLQYLDSGKYVPHLYVRNANQEVLLYKKLEAALDLHAIGQIQLSSKRVTIKPRKNSFTQKRPQVTFEL